MSEKFIGTLISFFGSDPKEVLWLFVEDEPESLEGTHMLKDGDHLTVFDENDGIVFDGLIECDYGRDGFRVKGFKAAWIQKGWEPDRWKDLFVTGKERPYRAELRKRTLH